jgi:phosphoserine aminotransferase
MTRSLSYFGPGPAALPASVLEEAAAAVREYAGSGLSILEIPHRGELFASILEEANSLVKRLCGLGNDYEVLWLTGGGRQQFAMVAQNLLAANPHAHAAYVDSGYWAAEAAEVGKTLGSVAVVASTRETGYRSVPDLSNLSLHPNTAYLHLTTNNTIWGTAQNGPPPSVHVPVVADMSSDILGVPRQYTDYDLFYAVAQKNLGPAGITLVCIRKNLLDRMNRTLPPIYSYRAHVAAGGILNTLPVFPIFVCLLMLRWTAQKGLSFLQEENRQKSEMLYAALEKSPLFNLPVLPASRSVMNCIWTAQSKEIEAAFLRFAEARGLTGLAGHRAAGAFRASLYNGVSKASVQLLVEALQDFQKTFRS